MNDDEIKKLIGTAEADQAYAGLENIAHQLGAYFRFLLAEDFSRAEALALVRSWQDGILETARRRP